MLYFNLGNMNWTSEFELLPASHSDRHRSGLYADWHGDGRAFFSISRLFTYGENVHRRGQHAHRESPLAGDAQPVVLPKWTMDEGERTAPLRRSLNWTSTPGRI
jgi:hypothetical protein